MVVEISNVLPALLTIKVDIALSKRYSRQPQASNRKLMTRLCMWHCSCANFFRGKKSCQILSSFDLCMLEMFMLWIFTITMLLYTQTLPKININIVQRLKNISKLEELPKIQLIVQYRQSFFALQTKNHKHAVSEFLFRVKTKGHSST